MTMTALQIAHTLRQPLLRRGDYPANAAEIIASDPEAVALLRSPRGEYGEDWPDSGIFQASMNERVERMLALVDAELARRAIDAALGDDACP